MWLWELRDIGIIIIGALISIVALTKTGIMLPMAITAGYGILTIRVDDLSIMMFLQNAWQYFIGRQQTYEWR